VRFLAAWPPALPCRGCRVPAHELLAPWPAAASDRTELTPTPGAGAGAEQSSALLECQRMHASMRLIGGSWRCVLLLERACHHGQVLLTEALIDGLHPLVCQAGKGGDRSPSAASRAR